MLLFMLSHLLLLFTDFFLHLFAQGIDADVALFMNKSLFTMSASTIKKLSNKLEPEPATFPHESKTYSWASS